MLRRLILAISLFAIGCSVFIQPCSSVEFMPISVSQASSSHLPFYAKFNKTWGIGGTNEYGNAIEIDSTSIFIAGNNSASAFIAKYDLEGNPQWNLEWNLGYATVGNDLGISSDAIYLVGANASSAYLVKYTKGGVYQWNRTWMQTSYTRGNGVDIDNLGDVYVVGTDGYSDSAIIVKYFSNGTKSWNSTWSGASYDNGYGIVVDENANVYITGC
nr:hypothetical protein [Candidatus Sigynarchaeota archaeon]